MAMAIALMSSITVTRAAREQERNCIAAILELPAGLVARNAALYLALNTDMAVNEAIALLIAVASPASVTELPRTGNGRLIA